jgi:parallel beta-helix repeat protein
MGKALNSFILLFLLTGTIIICGDAHAKSYTDCVREGNAYYKNKEYKKATKAYEEASRMADDNINVFFNLGLAYRSIKDFHSSISNFEKFLKEATDRKMIIAAKKLIKDMSEAISKPTTYGKLKHYETWEGWVLIDSDVIVPEDIVLTIKPGTLVMFTPLSSFFDAGTPYLKREDTEYFASLVVKGTLIAEGEKESEILFSNSYEDVATKKIGLWGGIIFEGSNDSVLKYAKIERAKNGVVIKSSPNIQFSNNVFMKNEIGVKLIDKSAVNLDNVIFYRNNIGIECGDYSEAKTINSNFTKNNYGIKVTDRAKPKITNNTFEENGCGICAYEKVFPKIFNNTFTNNSEFAISMSGNSESLIKDNEFFDNRIGVNSDSNSSPKISRNTFKGNVLSAINTVDSSKAVVEVNTFIDNAVAVSKVKDVRVLENTYENNDVDVKEVQ